MKVIQAFSWMTFVLIAFAIIVLMQLATQAQMYGRYNIWLEPIRGQILFTRSLLVLNHMQSCHGSEKHPDTIIPIPANIRRLKWSTHILP